MTTDTKTIHDFISEHNITISSEWADRNPHMDDSASMDNYKCRLRANGRQMTLYFSKGIAHHGVAPEADEVLDCLASDAAGFENAQGFEDWASEYGYDTDSRKAERIYATVERQAAKLKTLLGEDAYRQLLWDMERL